MPPIEIRILGPLEVVVETGSLSLPRGRARALLAILALNVEHVVSTDSLVDSLWGSAPPATARTKLHGLVSTLRKALSGPAGDREVIETTPPGYTLAVVPDQVDAIRFRDMVRQAPSIQPPAERVKLLRDALGLWRGAALADFLYEPFAQTQINALESLRIVALEHRVEAELEAGQHASVVPELEALIAEHPFRERLRELAILAHYRSGDQRNALQLARDTHVMFTEELGVEPGPALQSLELAVLNHDPVLEIAPEADERQTEVPADRLFSEGLKTVTVMFVETSLPADASSDPETQRAAVGRQHEAVQQAINRHGGSVQGSIGGVTVAVFGLPAAHEDDPVRAVHAAVELVSDGMMLRPSIGISTGEIVVGEAPLTSNLSGLVPRAAAKLQQAAPRGKVLLSDVTRRLIGAQAAVKAWPDRILDDAGRQLVAWQLVRQESREDVATKRGSAWVGRTEELARLHDAANAVAESDQPVCVTVTGEPGIGKTRLAAEFVASLADSHRVLNARCPPYGEGITFLPLREIIHSAAGGTDPDSIAAALDGLEQASTIAAQLAGAVGSSEYPGRPDVLFPAVRRFFEALAAKDPLVVVLDDLHWGQPTFVDLVEYLRDAVGGPLLLLCLARPEFLELRPAWAELDDTLTLSPLDHDHIQELVEQGLVENGLPYERATEIIELAGGNPLFVEQVLAALTERDTLTIPMSLQALLAARLDHLGPAERDLVRAASVWGVNFNATDLVEFLPAAMRSTVPTHLDTLDRKRFFTRTEDDDTFSFRHGLIQLAAYRSITKKTRARLHELVVDVLDATTPRTITEIDETVGYHLERAAALRTELGIDDAHTAVLARRAGEHLGKAGVQAFRRLDAMAAQGLLVRSLRLLPDGHPDWRSVARYLVETHQVMAHHDDARQLLDALVEEVETGDDTVLAAFLRIERLWTSVATGPDPLTLAEVEAEAATAQKVFTEAGYDIGLAQVGRLRWTLHRRRGEMAEMEEAAYRGLEWANRSTSGRERLGAEWGVAMALEEGGRPVEECIERCRRLRGDIENPGVASTLGYLYAMRGDFGEGRKLVDEALGLLRERVRARRPLAQVHRRAGDVELLAGDREAAERLYRQSVEAYREQGERDSIVQLAAELVRILVRSGRADEAPDLAALARESAPAESVTSQALWRTSQALVASTRGEHEEAERLAREAGELVPPDMLTLRANVLVDLSEVLAASGRHTESDRVADESLRLFELKGNVSGAKMARSLLKPR